MLNTLIIDDEPLAHKVIMHHLVSHTDINVVKHCYNATEALAWLASDSADLLFLDINMPALSGMDMLKVLANRPQVIIVSAYQEFALQSYELDVTDYLLKPVSAERLSLALDKVRSRVVSAPVPALPQDIVIKVDREQRRVAPGDITYLEAYGNYVKVWCGDTMLLANSTLKQLVAQLPGQMFTQIHKSYVVRNAAVIARDSESVMLQNKQRLKVGKSFKAVLASLL
ncbi:LytR/AlgR family response regulator transcription factor [Alteromonas gilva]|uniref:Response regulator n=1 Tax=Alteromonas gilva TaxID=2987522 RepID=A0ABT5KZG5_9ALTE|nr:response regulator transcription factor [Alteromonas gilva]MDC8829661.1 response regulator [Alteromonas gilva]